MKNVKALVAVSLALGCGSVQAVICNPQIFENPGFERGTECWNKNLTGGAQGGSATVVSSIFSLQNPPSGGNTPRFYWYPQEGQNFLALGTGTSGPNIWQSVTQTIEVANGTKLSGFAAFDWNDTFLSTNVPAPTVDGARVSIFQGTSTTGTAFDTPFNWSGASVIPPPPAPGGVRVPSYFNGLWTQWFSTALAAGTYTVEYAVRNTGDTRDQSFGYFDAVTAVPEPATLALFVIGLAGLTSMKRRKNVSLNCC